MIASKDILDIVGIEQDIQILNDDAIRIANKTCRANSAFGRSENPTTRAVMSMFDPESGFSILDFGAGKNAVQAKFLRDMGYSVTAYDFGCNVSDGIHDRYALQRKYDVVYASNVINVQSTAEMLANTLNEMKNAVNEDGWIVFNYPASPRKAFMNEYVSGKMLVDEIVPNLVGNVVKVIGEKTAPVVVVKTGK